MDVVAPVYTYCHYLSLYVYIYTLALVCLKYMYVLPLFVHTTLLAFWECDCVDEVACSMYIYIYGYCRYFIYMLSLFMRLM